MVDATHAQQSASQPSGPRKPPISARWRRDWWDPKGSSAMLHRLNPVRLGFIREAIDRHWGGDSDDARARWRARRALDVGCGAGLLCEPLARLGAASDRGRCRGRERRRGAGARRRLGPGDRLPRRRARHRSASARSTSSPARSARARRRQARRSSAELAARLAPGGLMILSTPNRTPQSQLLLVGAAEAIGAGPARHPSLGRLRHPGRAARAAGRGRAGDGRAARHRVLAVQGAAPVGRPVAQLHRHRAAGRRSTTSPSRHRTVQHPSC